MNIGQNIKQIRIKKNLTQLELAKKLENDDRTRISRFETGIREPSVKELLQIAKALGVSIKKLIG